MNIYGYVGANPIDSIDPPGLIAYICRSGDNIGIALPNSDVGGGYSVQTRVLIQDVPNTASNYVSVSPGEGSSWVYLATRNYGRWMQTPFYSDDRDYAHEAGHIMGIGHDGSASLMDKYASDTSFRVDDLEVALKSKFNKVDCGCSRK